MQQSPLRIVFMGSPEFAVPSLEALVDAGHAPLLVATQPPARRGRRAAETSSPVGEAAKRLGLPLLETSNVCKDEAFEQIAGLEPDIAVVVAFGQILRKNMLTLPTHGCINLHPSMLPKYRGAAPINWAMIDGVEDSGITVMRLVRALDAGPILAQAPFTIGREESAFDALARSAIDGAAMIAQVVERYAAGEDVQEVPQDEAQASYAGLFKKEDGLLDFGLRARALFNRVRGLQPWPGAFAYHTPADSAQTGERIAIQAARVEDESAPAASPPGTLLGANDAGIRVQCGQGVLSIQTLQREGKPKREAADFLRGYAMSAGDRFESQPRSKP